MSAFRRPSEILRATLLLLSLAAPAIGQPLAENAGGRDGQQSLPIVIVDQERLFDDSLFGQRILAEIDARSEELASENRRIEAMLIAEERAITEERQTMTQDAFRRRASEFDDRVTRLRAEQDAKLRAVSRLRDDARQDFYGRIGPILQDILDERDALVLLDRRAVLSAVGAADITDLAIGRIDDVIDDGSDLFEDGALPSSD
ncbi:OmpH family outer membrane protein [Palleronia sp. LCG004]|uniref:OmpH family outer membrane protein n=1 Tax=Palleronia sp. LCG004 TaxID=3079304 RepID=UPI002942BA0B|nr:OmpH family outer membrane protein [Palleronia sp. LCG004]WOI57017.1 OmpH family outer membrane protein [Palleronia sp. LCG004]